MIKYFFLLFLTVFLLQAQRQDIVLKIDGQVVENDSIVDLDVYIENYESGSIKLTGQKKEGKKEGLWIYYDEKGKPTHHAFYKNDSLMYYKYLWHRNGLFIIRPYDSI